MLRRFIDSSIIPTRVCTESTCTFCDSARISIASGCNGQLMANAGTAFVEATLEDVQFVEFLVGKGQPGLKIRPEIRFSVQIDRNMKQGAGRREFDPLLPKSRDHRFHPVKDGTEIGSPNIAAVDSAQRQNLVGSCSLNRRSQLFGSTDEIKVNSRHGQIERGLQIDTQ